MPAAFDELFDYRLTVDDEPSISDLLTSLLPSAICGLIRTPDSEKVHTLAIQEKPRRNHPISRCLGWMALSRFKRLKADPATRDIPVNLLEPHDGSLRHAGRVESPGRQPTSENAIDWDASWPKIQAILMRS
jgi:hypothetical protein